MVCHNRMADGFGPHRLQVAESLMAESEKQLSTQYLECTLTLLTKFVAPLRTESADVVDAEHTLAFHRLYSAIQFLACTEGPPDERSDRDVFGDGLAWGGCALVQAFGQQRRFSLLDYSYCILKAADAVGAPSGDHLLDNFIQVKRLPLCARGWAQGRAGFASVQWWWQWCVVRGVCGVFVWLGVCGGE